MRPPAAELPYLVHNNWISGYEPKVQRFRQTAMWLTTYSADEKPGESECVATALHATPPQLMGS